MFPIFMLAYATAAVAFYREVCRRAPIIEDEDLTPCQVYELFRNNEERRAA